MDRFTTIIKFLLDDPQRIDNMLPVEISAQEMLSGCALVRFADHAPGETALPIVPGGGCEISEEKRRSLLH
jgi:hypothetical protein